jgi:hypothetical protein
MAGHRSLIWVQDPSRWDHQPRRPRVVLALAATLAVVAGCSVGDAGTTIVTPAPTPIDAGFDDRPIVRPNVSTDGPPDLAPDATAPPDGGSPDLAPPRLDAGADTLGVPPATWTGPPLIVGVGQGGRRIVSRDGIAWTGDAMDAKGNADPTKNLAAVAYGNGLVVAVGGGCTTPTSCAGRILTFNGDKWADAMLPAGQSTLAGVAYGNGIWVAVGAAGPILTSSDGKRWTTSKASAPANLRAIGFGNIGGTYMFVATGERSVCWRSLDGANWTNMLQLFPNDDPPTSIHAVAVGDGVVVAAGERGRRIRSLNGTEWNAAAGGGNDLPSVLYADHLFLAYADNSVAWISSNAAQSWDFVTVVEAPTQAFATGVIRDSRLFVGASGGVIKTSTDGRGWKRVPNLAADGNAFTAFTFAGY